MRIPLYQLDAFTDRRFHGNPAAICPLEQWLPDSTLQAIAAENNLSETAYYVPAGAGADADFELRWFTPGVEVDLCGHATLATAVVALDVRREISAPQVRFKTKSGVLTVHREGDRYAMDFPSRPPAPCAPSSAIAEALGVAPSETLAARDYLCVYASESEVRALAPDMAKLAALDRFGMIVTAPGSDCDFVSRFFAPAKGVPEDPVTGSSHCTLIPYWAKRLGKELMHARQVSARGGELWCEMRGERVRISGHAVLYLTGEIEIASAAAAR